MKEKCDNWVEWLCEHCTDENLRNCACYFKNESGEQPQPFTENELQLTIFDVN